MQITREYLLYGIDYKRLRVQEMEDAIESLLGEINDAAEELKNLVNGSVRIGGETYAEILAARARARFCFNLLSEAKEHYSLIENVYGQLETAVRAAQARLDEVQETADTLLSLYE